MNITNWQAVQTCTGLQICKQWKPDTFPTFHDFPSGNLCKFSLLGEHPQSPLNSTCGVGCAFILNTFTYGLLRNLHRSSISHNRKNKMQDKLFLIIFVMRDNPLPDKLSGSIVGESPTSEKRCKRSDETSASLAIGNFVPSWHKVMCLFSINQLRPKLRRLTLVQLAPK